jgi:hypothetical protein
MVCCGHPCPRPNKRNKKEPFFISTVATTRELKNKEKKGSDLFLDKKTLAGFSNCEPAAKQKPLNMQNANTRPTKRLIYSTYLGKKTVPAASLA